MGKKTLKGNRKKRKRMKNKMVSRGKKKMKNKKRKVRRKNPRRKNQLMKNQKLSQTFQKTTKTPSNHPKKKKIFQNPTQILIWFPTSTTTLST